MPDTDTIRYTFSDADSYRSSQLTALLSSELKYDIRARMSLVTSESSEYSNFTSKMFDFFSAHSGGRYSDRSMMQLRRIGKRMEGTTAEGRFSSESETYLNLPVGLVVESPNGWNADTEVKSGGILGMYVIIPTDDGDCRGMIAVPNAVRRKGIASAMLDGEANYFHSRVALYAHSGNFAAAGVAAKNNLSAIQINSQSQVVQYQRVV